MNLKDAMSCFATGVTVVTTHDQGQDWGLTCSSFNTVSLDPALVLWSIRRTSLSHAAFVSAPGYVVNVLAADQQALAQRFAVGTQAERFAGLPLVRDHDMPRLPQALAWFVCQTVQVVPAGDHDILIGQVQAFGCHAGEPLVHVQRRFGVLAPFDA